MTNRIHEIRKRLTGTSVPNSIKNNTLRGIGANHPIKIKGGKK